MHFNQKNTGGCFPVKMVQFTPAEVKALIECSCKHAKATGKNRIMVKWFYFQSVDSDIGESLGMCVCFVSSMG